MGKSHDEHYLKAATRLGDFQLVVTHQAIYSSGGVKLIDRGVRVDSQLYHRLLNHTLQAPIDESLTAEKTVTHAELRDQAERLIAERAFYGRLAANAGDRAAVLGAIGGIALPQAMAFRLTVARDCHNAVFSHSLQVALIALYLGLRQGLTTAHLRALAAAALLHDLGVLHIDPRMLEAGHRITAVERRQLLAHPLTAAMIVEQRPEYPPEVARAILEHHERHDGSGYPRGLKGNEISVAGRILLLAELVAALLDKKVREPGKGLSLILRLNHDQFDPTMSKHIFRLLTNEAAGQTAPEQEQRNAEHLKRLEEECDKWRQARSQLDSYTSAAPAIATFLADRIAALERSLADAGLHPDQIKSTLINLGDQPAAVNELAMLMRETGWQLKTIIQDVFARFPELETSEKPGERAIRDWLLQLQERLNVSSGKLASDATPAEAGPETTSAVPAPGTE